MQPSLIAYGHGDMVVSSLRTLANADAEHEEQQRQKAHATMLATYGYGSGGNDKPFAFADGIAFIPVSGLLINRFSSCWGYVTGYNFIRSQVQAAVADPDVTMLVLDCNSNGGEVAGCFELAADIRAARDQKPILAVVDSNCYSACYAVASAATKIIGAPSSGEGSIGVVAMHVDMSKMLQDWGITVTFIHSGDHKVDGNPYQALPAPVRKSIQARVDNTRQEFVSLVAANRGLDAKVVFDTEAACYTAAEALDIGLIDGIAAPQVAVSSFLTELSARQSKENTMSQAEKPGAEAQTATASTTVDANAERAAERDRIRAITGHDAAKDRATLANHLALNTNLSVDEAAKILAAAPTEKKEQATTTGTSAFEAAMNSTEHPNVGADTSASGEMTAAQRILASQSLVTGIKH
jgi:signal peptide peptidase SppA